MYKHICRYCDRTFTSPTRKRGRTYCSQQCNWKELGRDLNAEKIISEYQEGISLQRIAAKNNVYAAKIRAVLHSNNIALRPNPRSKKNFELTPTVR